MKSGKPSLSMSTKITYDEIFNSDSAHMQALRELFLAGGEVGPRKQQRRSATQA